jgi:hypothetical protein
VILTLGGEVIYGRGTAPTTLWHTPTPSHTSCPVLSVVVRTIYCLPQSKKYFIFTLFYPTGTVADGRVGFTTKIKKMTFFSSFHSNFGFFFCGSHTWNVFGVTITSSVSQPA